MFFMKLESRCGDLPDAAARYGMLISLPVECTMQG
jgi:hypothetical protein